MGAAYNSFGEDERLELQSFGIRARAGEPLSGYLAGKQRGGDQVVLLEEAWSEVFRVKHSIAVNSATSGLLAAAFAADLNDLDTSFVCPTMTMSATAAAPCFTGAHPLFSDVTDDDFSGNELALEIHPKKIKAEFVTNLFGHAARLKMLRERCDKLGRVLIEDNAQSPFATDNGALAGTVGHIGVFSLNIHKPLQCGEGGMIVTNDDDLAERMRAFINHGEHVNGRIGLNLRMPELCAVVALTQLQRAPAIIDARIEQANAIIDAIGFIPGLRPPVRRHNCKHVYYTIPFLIDRSRSAFTESLISSGVPISERYAKPLHLMPAFEKYRGTDLPVATDLYEKRLFYIENCAHTFSKAEIKKIGAAFKRAADSVKL